MEPTHENLDSRISAVEAKLRNVVSDIQDVSDAVKTATGEDRMLLLREKVALREEKAALQQEKVALQREKAALQENETALQQEKAALQQKEVLLLTGMVAERHAKEYVKVLCVVCDPCVVEVGKPSLPPSSFLTTFSFVSSFPDTHNVCVSSRRERSW